MSSATSSLIQSSSSEVEGFFFRPGVSRTSKNAASASRQQLLLQVREVHPDDGAIVSSSGKRM